MLLYANSLNCYVLHCLLKNGVLFQAVCCSDGASCCPNGYTCDVAHHLCNPTDVSVNLKPMKAASRIPTLSSNELSTGDKANIDCPDKSSCSDDSTCCQLSDGHYACCPLQNVSKNLWKIL